jgi:hypothetical protein
MKSADNLTKDEEDYCFVKEGEIYAIYMPVGKDTEIKLPSGDFTIQWFDPATGNAPSTGSVNKLTGGGFVFTGSPPADNIKDWVCLIRKY